MGVGLSDRFLIRVLGATGLVGLLTAVLRIVEQGFGTMVVLDLVIAAVAFGATRVGDRLRRRWGILVVVIAGSVVGTIALVHAGQPGDAMLLYAGVATLSFLQWERPTDTWTSVLASLALLAVTGLVATGSLRYPAAAQGQVNQAGNWAMGTLKFLLLVYVVGSAIREMKRRLGQKVAELEEANRQLERVAYTDRLTGLINRAGFEQQTPQQLVAGRMGVLLVLDIQGLSLINALHGERRGDEAMKALAAELRAREDGRTLFARFPGPKFAGWLGGQDAAAAAELVGAVERGVAATLGAQHRLQFTSACVRYPEDGADLGDLIRKANLALRLAKSQQRLDPVAYAGHMDHLVREEQELAARVQAALKAEAFTPVYQKKVDIRTGAVVGVEGLARLLAEPGAPPPPGPAVFIPILLQQGLVAEFTKIIFRKVLLDLPEIQRRLGPQAKVSINVSPLFFLTGEFLPFLRRTLEELAVAPGDLVVELTEEAFIEDAQRMNEVCAGLRALGCHLALDDFGQGYSSLGSLRQFQFDEIKIDRLFVKDLGEDRKVRDLFRSICTIAESLGCTAVAEGVETETQLALVREAGCGIVQGYYFSRPEPLTSL